MRNASIALALFLTGCATSGCGVVIPAIQHSARQKDFARSSAESGATVALTKAVFERLSRGTVGYNPSHPIHVGWIDTPILNAVSAGGGHFAITRGLLSIDNPCLLWGIVAHELAHDQLDHPAQQLRAQMTVGALSTAAGFIPIAGALGAPLIVGVAGHAGILAYSRSQETAADAKAVELIRSANLPPWALRYALEFLRDARTTTPAAVGSPRTR